MKKKRKKKEKEKLSVPFILDIDLVRIDMSTVYHAFRPLRSRMGVEF